MRTSEVCIRQVATIHPHASVLAAAKQMREQHVGDLLVTERRGERDVPTGIVTDRDLATSVLARELDPTELEVCDVMERDLVTASDDEDVGEVLRRMRKFGVRRVPVLDPSGALLGVLTLDDALDAICTELAELAAVSRHQLRIEYGRRR